MSAARSNEAEAVANPLHDRAADEDAALERVLGAVADLPRDGRHQLLPRRRAASCRCSAAGSSRCRTCSSTCRARGTSDRRARPADRRRCRRSACRRARATWKPSRTLRSTSAPPAAGSPERRTAAAVRRPTRSVWMLNSIVREALLTSVTCCVPPVSFQTSQVSTVPNASSPASARARAPGTLSRIQRILLAEK